MEKIPPCKEHRLAECKLQNENHIIGVPTTPELPVNTLVANKVFFLNYSHSALLAADPFWASCVRGVEAQLSALYEHLLACSGLECTLGTDPPAPWDLVLFTWSLWCAPTTVVQPPVKDLRWQYTRSCSVE
ncbi:hypothetical protein Tco_0972865 [Tanacetum coccineum]